MHYLLSENEKHIEINYDNLLPGRCGAQRICYPLPAQSSQGMAKLSAHQDAGMLWGDKSVCGRRQDVPQIDYFISGAWSLYQDRNVLC